MHNIDGWTCPDAVGAAPGRYEPCVAYYLDGPAQSGVRANRRCAPAAHFAGGRLGAGGFELEDEYSFEVWCWNGLPIDSRLVTGYLFSRGKHAKKAAVGDHFGVGGTEKGADFQGKLFIFNGDDRYESVVGKTPVAEKTWTHVAFIRKGDNIRLFLDGKLDASGTLTPTFAQGKAQIYVGGRCDNHFGWEGKTV